MKPLGCLGVGLSLISGCIFLALVAEFYYFFWWKKRGSSRDVEENYSSPVKELPDLFCWKKPTSLSPTALKPQEICISVNGATHSEEEQPHLRSISGNDLVLKPLGGEDTVDAELMCLAGPPRSLFTIEEETQEELESEDAIARGGRSRRCCTGKSLRDLLLVSETPTLTPLSSPPLFSPPLTPMACYKQNGFNPLFEPTKDEALAWMWSSPPPTLKFLKDAEEKLYRKTLVEEALKVQKGRSRHVESKENKEASVAPLLPPVAAISPQAIPLANGKPQRDLIISNEFPIEFSSNA
ncbi:unnamed protein product [Musa acuminata subsp. burmannicoides]